MYNYLKKSLLQIYNFINYQKIIKNLKLIYYNNYIIFFPLLYTTFFINNYSIKISIALLYSFYLYKYGLFYLENIIDNILLIKIKLSKKYFKKNDFVLTKVLLYTNLKDNIDVTSYFKKCNFNKISRNNIKELFDFKNIPLEYNSNIRLKIFFSYKNINYILYFPYSQNINKEFENYYIPYPPYSEKIIEKYRHDIIEPFHNNEHKKKFLYSLFSIDSKNILNIKINDVENLQLLNYFQCLKTPFNDFGILYNVPVKLIWALYENNIDLENFNNFELTFLNPYFDEDNFELIEHNIKLSNNELNNIIISNYHKDILDKKNNYIIK